MESVGRLYISLQKANGPNKWPILFKTGQRKPTNMLVWWDLVEKYENELNPYDPDYVAPKKSKKDKSKETSKDDNEAKDKKNDDKDSTTTSSEES